ncbi:ribosome maturation factor RimM [Emcibacter sp.]|uniref:ribosome maturation factor RimM n=1 Tax=Emcibacter sp. TaxID=1979954 RepID=UPI002AA76505|nr:ribosome maturation factor RimM [Emcibacter sp.]
MADRSVQKDTRNAGVAVGPDWVCIAAIAGAQGVRGNVRLKVFTEDLASVADYGPVTLFTEEHPRGEKHKIQLLHTVKGGVAARLEGIGDRDRALALKGQKLYVKKAALPDLAEDDSFYYEDLVGLEARDEQGNPFGTVNAVFNFGAGDLLEVALDPALNDGEKGTVLYPFSGKFVPEVNIEDGFVVVDRESFGDRDA